MPCNSGLFNTPTDGWTVPPSALFKQAFADDRRRGAKQVTECCKQAQCSDLGFFNCIADLQYLLGFDPYDFIVVKLLTVLFTGTRFGIGGVKNTV